MFPVSNKTLSESSNESSSSISILSDFSKIGGSGGRINVELFVFSCVALNYKNKNKIIVFYYKTNLTK